MFSSDFSFISFSHISLSLSMGIFTFHLHLHASLTASAAATHSQEEYSEGGGGGVEERRLCDGDSSVFKVSCAAFAFAHAFYTRSLFFFRFFLRSLFLLVFLLFFRFSSKLFCFVQAATRRDTSVGSCGRYSTEQQSTNNARANGRTEERKNEQRNERTSRDEGGRYEEEHRKNTASNEHGEQWTTQHWLWLRQMANTFHNSRKNFFRSLSLSHITRIRSVCSRAAACLLSLSLSLWLSFAIAASLAAPLPSLSLFLYYSLSLPVSSDKANPQHALLFACFFPAFCPLFSRFFLSLLTVFCSASFRLFFCAMSFIIYAHLVRGMWQFIMHKFKAYARYARFLSLT